MDRGYRPDRQFHVFHQVGHSPDRIGTNGQDESLCEFLDHLRDAIPMRQQQSRIGREVREVAGNLFGDFKQLAGLTCQIGLALLRLDAVDRLREQPEVFVVFHTVAQILPANGVHWPFEARLRIMQVVTAGRIEEPSIAVAVGR